MFEVRCHGRGGFGVKTTAHVLGRVAFLSGFQTQDFALYGAERRGAPLTSFTRYDKSTILERGYVTEPDAVIIIDELLDFTMMLKGLKPEGFVLINSAHPAEFFKKKYNIKQKVYTIDATGIAIKHIGKPLPNMAILGAFLKFVDLPFKNLEAAVETQLNDAKHPEAIKENINAAKECFKMVK